MLHHGEENMLTDIKPSLFDEAFRQQVVKYIQEASKSIKIVTGEISAYNYLELRNPAEEAADRGIEIDVYATGPDIDIINRLIHNGINVYIGSEDPQEHLMIVDDKKMIISSKEKNRPIPTPMGNRKGQTVVNESRKIKEKISEFQRLKEKAIKKEIEGQDPLERKFGKPTSQL